MIAGALGMAVALVATIVVWSFALGTWVRHRLAVAGAVAGVLLSLSIPRPLAALIGAPLVLAYGVVLGILVAVGATLIVMRKQAVRWSPDAARTWAGASVGGVVWLSVVALSQAIPGAARRGWVLNGDGLLQMEAIGRSLQNPEFAFARVPYAFLGLIASPFGKIELTGSEIGTEVYALVIAWALQLALWCVIAGGVVSSIVPTRSHRMTVIVAALGSLLPLTALMGGIAMEWGYVNANVAIPAALLSWLALTESRRRPFAAFSVLLVIMSVLWLSWEPLAAIPGAAAVVVAWRVRRDIRSLRGFRLTVVALSCTQFLVIFGSNYLNRSTNAGEALTIEGHGLPSMWLGLAIASGVALAGATAGRTMFPSWVHPATLSVVVGSALALGVVLLFTIGDPAALMGYYPTKLTYFLCAVMFTVATAIATGLLVRLRSRIAASVSTVGILLVALTVSATIVPTAPGLTDTALRRQPPVAVLAGTQWAEGEASVDRFLYLAQPETLGFLWRSGNPDEAIIDYRVIVTNGGTAHGDIPLRMVAFAGYQGRRASPDYPGVTANQMCTVLERMPGVTVYSKDPEAALEELAETCEGDVSMLSVRPVDELDHPLR